MQNSALEHAERARRLAQNRYRARLASFLELNAAETNQAEAESGYVESIYNLKMAEAGLRFLTGDLRVQ
jgi:outer membrane protein TolC